MTIDIVVADDLTGAADTVAQFLPVAAHVLVFPSVRRFAQAVAQHRLPAGDLAIGVSAESRHLSPAEAAKRVLRAHRAALRLAPRLLFQKVDSAMRGNPGAELAAYRAATGAELVVLSPTFLPSGRTVRDGVLLVDGVPLAESGVAADPRTPTRESFVPALLRGQTDTPIATLPATILRGPVSALNAALEGAAGIVLFDAECEDDLARLARLVLDRGLLHAVSGSAGLAASLAPLLAGSPPRKVASAAPDARRRVLAIIGSPHATARAQVAQALSAYEREANVLAPLPGSRIADRRWRQRLVAQLAVAGLAIVTPPPLSGSAAGAPTLAPDKMARALAASAFALVSTGAAKALVVSGGDVAAAVCAALRVEWIALVDQIFPGAPSGVVCGGPAAGLPLVTKSGAHGPPDGLVRILNRLGAAAPRKSPQGHGGSRVGAPPLSAIEIGSLPSAVWEPSTSADQGE